MIVDEYREMFGGEGHESRSRTRSQLALILQIFCLGDFEFCLR
jgi:hypothetical protein